MQSMDETVISDDLKNNLENTKRTREQIILKVNHFISAIRNRHLTIILKVVT